MSKTPRVNASLRFHRTATLLRCAIAWLIICLSAADAKTLTTSKTKSDLRGVRVLVGRNVDDFKLRSVSAVTLEDADGKIFYRTTPNQWVRIRANSGKIFIDGVAYRVNAFMVRSFSDAPLELSKRNKDGWADGILYPGAFRCFVSSAKKIHIVNFVEVETYVAGVVAREVWPTFATQAYRAQAIAARSFVLCQMQFRQSKEWDVTNGQGSQVYGGLREDRTGRLATQATKYTEGIVCIYDDGEKTEIVRTYYSAACGGMTQSAAIFGPADDIPPLAGGVACDYCNIAPQNNYRWKTVRLRKQEIFRLITARHKSLQSLGQLRNLSIVKRSAEGRPVTIRLHGNGDQHHDMLVEKFRLWLGGNKLRSSDFKMRVVGDTVAFENGRGYGHGLGLCQWGMEGQAREGKSAAEILRFYFPGSQLQRAY